MILDIDAKALGDGSTGIQLTDQEYALAFYLAPGQRAHRPKIIGAVWGGGASAAANHRLAVLVTRLRIKLRAFGDRLKVVPLYDFGYRLSEPLAIHRSARLIAVRAECWPDLERLLRSHPDHVAAGQALASMVGE